MGTFRRKTKKNNIKNNNKTKHETPHRHSGSQPASASSNTTRDLNELRLSNYTHSHELASTNSTWELQARKAATSRAWRTSPLRLLRSALVSMVRCCRVTATQPVLEEDMDKKKDPAGSFLIEISCVAAESSTEVPEFSFTNSPLVVYALCSSLAKTAITISAIKSQKCLKSLNRIRFDAVDLQHCF